MPAEEADLLKPILKLTTGDLRLLSKEHRDLINKNTDTLMQDTLDGIEMIKFEMTDLNRRGESGRIEDLTLVIGLLGNLLAAAIYLQETCELAERARMH